MTRKRDIEADIEELKADTVDENAPKTKIEHGVTADFVHFKGEELPELKDGWRWETDGQFNTAVREEVND